MRVLAESGKGAARMFWKVSKSREFLLKSFYSILELEMEVSFP